MEKVGIRELRNQVAAIVRRAGHGERIVITVDGEPVAQLGPLHPAGQATIEDLAAAGLVRLPVRSERAEHPTPSTVPIDVRAATAIFELRGGPDQRLRR